MGSRPGMPGTRALCDFCGLSFATGRDLDDHRLEHHAGGPFAPRCGACGQRFETAAELTSHQQVAHRSVE
jgi:hypothetical protein